MYAHKVRRIAWRILIVYALLVAIVCVGVGVSTSSHFACLLLGLCFSPLMGVAFSVRRSSVPVIGRDVPVPSSIPTAYRVGKHKGVRE